MSILPNPGFAEAQRRLRQHFGEAVTFYGEPVVTFPPGTPIDPETGEPFDPAVEPVTQQTPSASAMCNVTFKAINRAGVGGERRQGAAGDPELTHVLLITDSSRAADLEPMRRFEVRGEGFLITAQKPDVGWQERWLVYGRKDR